MPGRDGLSHSTIEWYREALDSALTEVGQLRADLSRKEDEFASSISNAGTCAPAEVGHSPLGSQRGRDSGAAPVSAVGPLPGSNALPTVAAPTPGEEEELDSPSFKPLSLTDLEARGFRRHGRTVMVGGFAPGNEAPNVRAVELSETPSSSHERCRACDQKRDDLVSDEFPLCAQCAKAHRMGYRCGEESAWADAGLRLQALGHVAEAAQAIVDLDRQILEGAMPTATETMKAHYRLGETLRALRAGDEATDKRSVDKE